MGNINYKYSSQFIEDLLEDVDFIELRKYAKENRVPIMNSQTKELLVSLIKIAKPKKILEIGTAIGYSSLIFSKYSDAQITTIEIDEETAKIANNNFKKYKTSINLINNDAMKALRSIDQGFDFVFIDANKSRYLDYFKITSKLLNEGGIIVADNVLFRGEVCNDDLIEKRKITLVKNLRKFLAYITNNEDFISSIIPIGDGLTISVRR
ncbi:O-methyltransferase [Anaerococcus sp. NML200574]|uniref:O-methyltransferase n=1 Tax=unclassified Anaerococcus TaxID=2614126 RepID=UPI0022374B6B|nr:MULTISPECIES: O-methyltransferase [unclassified Anaerococcus]MCW6678056.1 O-methyltransferase [Anaerococcus sp. NML200574]MCW6701194.1 O-methyltransferase [Anaerococcus sp. NML200537]